MALGWGCCRASTCSCLSSPSVAWPAVLGPRQHRASWCEDSPAGASVVLHAADILVLLNELDRATSMQRGPSSCRTMHEENNGRPEHLVLCLLQ